MKGNPFFIQKRPGMIDKAVGKERIIKLIKFRSMSNEKDVLNISLPSGGNLKVNVNNFGDLARAAGMFSPADLNAIMRAIAQYNHCTSKLNELEEEETETIENATEPDPEQIEERSICG